MTRNLAEPGVLVASRGHGEITSGPCVSLDKATIALGLELGVVVLDALTLQLTRQHAVPGPVHCAALWPDGRLLVRWKRHTWRRTNNGRQAFIAQDGTLHDRRRIEPGWRGGRLQLQDEHEAIDVIHVAGEPGVNELEDGLGGILRWDRQSLSRWVDGTCVAQWRAVSLQREKARLAIELKRGPHLCVTGRYRRLARAQ